MQAERLSQPAAGISVALGETGDFPAAVSIFERSNLAYRDGVWPARESALERLRDGLFAGSSWCVLARQEGIAVAMAAIKAARAENGTGRAIVGSWFLSHLFVLPEYWGRGFGRIVLEATLAEIAKRGGHEVVLLARKDNERSHRIYRRLGFRETGKSFEAQAEWRRTF